MAVYRIGQADQNREEPFLKIIIVRHAAAIDRDGVVTDERRYLTPEGRDYFRKTARTIGQKGADPGLILTSPLLRAVQTADILAETLAYQGPLEAVAELEPGFDLAALERLLGNCRQVRQLVIVGHEPDLGRLVAALLHLANAFPFRKGSAIRLNFDQNDLRYPATFKWLAAGRKLITSREEAFS
jgi:phosphohistidine phosphatase